MSIELKQAAQQMLDALENVVDYEKINAARKNLRTAIQQAEPKHRHWSEALADDLTESGDIQTNAHPAPDVPDDVVRDAERYRWLRDNQLLAKTQYMPTSPRGHLDAAIDAAMLAASPAQKGGE